MRLRIAQLLVLGLLIANHPKADEMAKTMLGFKDLFLLGFFLSIGLSGELTWETVAIGVLLTLFLTNTTLNVQSYIGCIMLGGIVVNNAIVLVDTILLLRRRMVNLAKHILSTLNLPML